MAECGITFQEFNTKDPNDISDRWSKWIQRLNRYLMHTKETENDRKLNALFLFGGYDLEAIYDQNKETSDTYEQVVEKLSKHFKRDIYKLKTFTTTNTTTSSSSSRNSSSTNKIITRNKSERKFTPNKPKTVSLPAKNLYIEDLFKKGSELSLDSIYKSLEDKSFCLEKKSIMHTEIIHQFIQFNFEAIEERSLLVELLYKHVTEYFKLNHRISVKRAQKDQKHVTRKYGIYMQLRCEKYYMRNSGFGPSEHPCKKLYVARYDKNEYKLEIIADDENICEHFRPNYKSENEDEA
jgi:hypothetical protein